MRIGQSLQLVEPSVSHLRLTLTYLKTSHCQTQQHLKHSPAPFILMLPPTQRRVGSERLSPLRENTEGS